MTKSKKEAKIMSHKELLNEYMNLLLNMSGTFKLLSEKSSEFTHLEQHVVEYIAQQKYL